MNKDNVIYRLPEIARQIISFLTGVIAAHTAGDESAGYAVRAYVDNELPNLLSQFTSERQSKRIMTVTQFALDGIRCRLGNGETPRDDGFFPETIGDRSDAEEVLEAALLIARDEPQEKKIPYIGKLFENAYFDASIHPGLLHFLYKESESLTYRQLCILKIIIENEYPLGLKSIVEKPWLTEDLVSTIPPDAFPALVECVNLGNRGYITYELSPPDDTRSGAVALLVPQSMRYTAPALQMYAHMGLSSIPKKDVIPIAKSLE